MIDQFLKHNQYNIYSKYDFIVTLSIILSCLPSSITAQRKYDITFASFGNQMYQGGSKDQLTIKLEGTDGRRTESYILPGTCLFDYKNAPCSFQPELLDVGEIRYLYMMTTGTDDFMLDKIIVDGKTIDEEIEDFPSTLWKLFEYTQQQKYPQGCQIAVIDILYQSISEAPQIPLCTFFQTSTDNPTIKPTINPTINPTNIPTFTSTFNKTNNLHTTVGWTDSTTNLSHKMGTDTLNAPIEIAWFIVVIIMFIIVIIYIIWKKNAKRYTDSQFGKHKSYQNVDPHTDIDTDSGDDGQNTFSAEENNNVLVPFNMEQISEIVERYPNIIETVLNKQRSDEGTSTTTTEDTSLVNTETELHSHLGSASHAKHFIEIN
eukprot:334049_1